MFVKETGHPLKDITHAIVRLIQVDTYSYHIKCTTVYDWDDGVSHETIAEFITCQYPATAGWIYSRMRDLRNCTNTGAIVKDIPFCDE